VPLSCPGDANHSPWTGIDSITINAAPSTTTVTCNEVIYNGQPQNCTAAVTPAGVCSGLVAYSDAGSHPETAACTPADSNYAPSTGSGTLVVDPANQNPAVTCTSPVTYNGQPQSCTISGGFGQCSSGTVTSVPGGTVALSCAGDPNHNPWTGSGSITINAATSTTTVTCNEVIYSGAPQNCTAAVTPAGSCTGLVAYTEAGSYSESATCTPADTNYLASTGSGTLIIDKANLSPMPVCPIGVVYNGQPQSCTLPAGCTSGSVINVPGGTVTLSCPGDNDHNAWTSSGSITINPAAPVLGITCGSFPYDGQLHGCVATATGVKGETVSGSFSYSPAQSESAVGNYSVTATFSSGTGNYSSNGQVTGALSITGTTPVACTMVCNAVNYDGTPHACTVTSVAGAAITGPAAYVNAGSYPQTATCTAAGYSANTASGTLVINKAMAAITCAASEQFVSAATPVQPCGVYAGGNLIAGAVVTYKTVTGAKLTANKQAMTLTAPANATATAKVASASAVATGNYAVAPFTAQTFAVLQVPVTLTCGYTPIVSYANAAGPEFPAQPTYGDSGSLVCSTGVPEGTPADPESVTYAKVKEGTASVKSTLAKNATSGEEVVTFKAAESFEVEAKVAAGKGCAGQSWTQTVTVQPKPISVELNSPAWTYGKAPAAAEKLVFSLAAGSAPLAFSTDKLPGTAATATMALPYTVLDAANNDETGKATTAPQSLGIGAYTVTPIAAVLEEAMKGNYVVTPVAGELIVSPDTTKVTASPGSEAISSVKVGTTGTAATPVTVTNKSGELVTLTAVTTDARFTAAPGAGCTGLASGSSCTISVSFTPAAAGAAPASGAPAIYLNITAADANGDLFQSGTDAITFPVLAIKLSGSGK